jgi:cell division protein FtsI (penicillin-binding protein 3)
MATTSRQKKAEKLVRQEQAVMPSFRARRWSLLALLWAFCLALVLRAIDQQIFETDFLQREGKNRHLRVVEVSAHRGMIMDRRGEPLAISTPVDSVWANPRRFKPDQRQLTALAAVLGRDAGELQQYLAKRKNRSFVYLMRRANPDVADKVKQLMHELEIHGVGLQREYQRFYPGGEVFSHLVGFTDINDQGQEGVELAFDKWLGAVPGSKRVVQDGKRRAVDTVESIRAPQAGRALYLSLDWRLQFLAYRELKRAVKQHHARSGSAVILDARSGEVLAMVNQPSYNPNDSSERRGSRLRNRAMTDVFEPGSTMKPFAVTAALELGRVGRWTKIDTSPGEMRIGSAVVRDHHDYGILDVAAVIKKSSNVGVSKIALELSSEELSQHLLALGFGSASDSGFPGEVSGYINSAGRWSKIEQATLSFGYGLSVTPLQLARAYAVLAADGVRRPISLMRLDQIPEGERVMSVENARIIRSMLEAVVSEEGTAPLAAIKGYRVAGKTGTVKKTDRGGYAEDKFQAVFAGMAPASNPRLVMVVVIDEPGGQKYYGGEVAAPVFSSVMAGALRILNIPPDDLPPNELRLADVGGVR